MTFQTSPYMSWIFPDEAIEMNKYGVHSMRPTYLPNFQGEMGSSTNTWRDEARVLALQRVENTKRAKLGMEGKINTTARSQRYERPASRSAVPNGVFQGSPMEYITSSPALRGGVITSPEGRKWLATRLEQRKSEYEALGTRDFSKGSPLPISTSPYSNLDLLLSQIFASFGAGSFTNSLADSLNRLLQGFLRIGATITPNQLGTYARAIQKLIETIRGYRGGEVGIAFERPNIEGQLAGEQPRPAIYNPAEERLRLVESLQTTLNTIDAVIREIARTINAPESARQQVMSQLSQRLLGEQIQEYNPSFAEDERQQAVENVPGVEMGVPSSGRLTGPTFAQEEAQRQADLEHGAVWDWENVDEEAPAEGQGKKRRGRPRKH